MPDDFPVEGCSAADPCFERRPSWEASQEHGIGEAVSMVRSTPWLGVLVLWMFVPACPSRAPRQCPRTACIPASKSRSRPPAREVPPRAVMASLAHVVLPFGRREAEPVSVSLSPNGRYMAVGRRYGLVDLVRLTDGKVVRRLGSMDELRDGVYVQFSRNGGVLACAGKGKNHIQIWDPDLGRLKKEWTTGLERITSVALAGMDKLLVSGPGGRIEAYDMTSGKLLGRLKTTYGLDLVDMDGAWDGNWVAAALEGSRLDIFNLETFQKVGRAELHSGLSAVAFVPNQDKIAVGTTSGSIGFRAVPFGNEVDQPRLMAPGPIRDLRFDGSGRILAAGLASGGLVLFNARNGRRQILRSGAKKAVSTIVLGPKAGMVAAVQEGVGVHLWWEDGLGMKPRPPRIETSDRRPAVVPSVLMHRKVVVVSSVPFPVSRIALDRSGRFVAASGQPEQVAVWDTHSGKRRWYAKKPPGHVGYQTYLAKKAPRPVVMDFNPRNGRLYAFGRSNRVYRWHGQTGRPIHLWLNAKGTLKGLLFAEDGRSFFLLLEEQKVRRYRGDGQLLGTIKLTENPYWIGVCPTGKRFLSIAGWDEMSLYDVASGKRLWHRPSGRFDVYTVLGVRFDRDCKRIVTYHASGFVRVYDAETGEFIERIPVPLPEEPQSCAIHPNARWIACVRGRSVTLFSPFDHFKLDLQVPVGIGGALRDVVFSLSGNALAAQVGEQGLVVWRFGVGPKVTPGSAKQPGPPRPSPRPGVVPRIGARPRVGVPRIVFPRARGIRRRAPRLSPVSSGPTLPDVEPRLGGRSSGGKGKSRPKSRPKSRGRPRTRPRTRPNRPR